MSPERTYPEVQGLLVVLVVQVVFGLVVMLATFDNVARGLISWGVPELQGTLAALLFDLVALGALCFLYCITGQGCLGFLIMAAASIGIWGTYFTLAMLGGWKPSP